MKRVCPVCGASRETLMVIELPCPVDACPGVLGLATVAQPPLAEPRQFRVLRHADGSVTARRDAVADDPTVTRVLARINERAEALDRAGFCAGGDLLRHLVADLRDEFSK